MLVTLAVIGIVATLTDTPIYGAIYYDVNGTKAPNTFGIDLFQFSITKNGIIPVGELWTDKTKIMEYCYVSGLSCQAWVLRYDNMDYKRCKGLVYGGKSSCN